MTDTSTAHTKSQPNRLDPKTFDEWRIASERTGLQRGLKVAESMMKSVISGNMPLAIISGAAGIGKDYMASRLARAAGITMETIEAASAASFYRELVDVTRRGIDVVLFSDAQGFMADTQRANLMKAATDIGRGRIVRWPKDVRDVPQQVEVRCGMIVLLNPDLSDAQQVTAKMRSHIAALDNRAAGVLNIDTTEQEIFEYTLNLMLNGQMLRKIGVRIEESQAIVRTFALGANRLGSVSPRQVVLMAPVARALREDGMSVEQMQNALTDQFAHGRERRRLTLPVDREGRLFAWCRIVPPWERHGVPLDERNERREITLRRKAARQRRRAQERAEADAKARAEAKADTPPENASRPDPDAANVESRSGAKVIPLRIVPTTVPPS